jgi:hypothetical protein
MHTIATILVGLMLVRAEAGASTWDESVKIASDAIQPHVAVGADGAIYVTCLYKGNIAVLISRDRGRTFGEPTIAIDVGGHMMGGMHRGPRIGVDAKNNLVVTAPAVTDDAEFKRKYPTADLYAVTSKDGGKTWTEPVRVNEVSKQAPESLHWLAVAPNGDAHIVWLDRRDRTGPGQDIYYAKLANGKVGKNVQIASLVCECCAPGLAVDASGNPLVAYREGGQKPSREVFAIRSADRGAAFEQPFQLNSKGTLEDGCPMSAPAVALSRDGKKFAVAWKDVRTGRNDPHVYWGISESPGSFTDAPIDFQPKVKQNHPSMAFDSGGEAWVAWEDTRSGTQRIWARKFGDDKSSAPVSDVAEGDASFPSAASNSDIVVVAYEAVHQGQKTIRLRVLAPGGRAGGRN